MPEARQVSIVAAVTIGVAAVVAHLISRRRRFVSFGASDELDDDDRPPSTSSYETGIRLTPKEIRFNPAPRATLGVVQIATDLVMDTEGSLLIARLPGVEIRHTKITFDAEEIRADTYQRALSSGAIKDAVDALAWPQKNCAGQDYITIWGISCTSMSFILGEEKLRACFPKGASTTNMWLAVLQALRAVGAKRLAVFTPYIKEVTANNEQLFRENGFDVVGSMSLGLTRDVETSRVTQEYIADCVEELAKSATDADTVFIGCSAFRACTPNFVSSLEEKLRGVHVITSTQAFLWHMLRSAGVEDKVDGYGKLFQQGQPHSQCVSSLAKSA